eukprot:PhF_6_TR13613/c0_g1_i1/m.21785/K10395/KIF4_21_27; kinesin family member 4/21/27
MTSETSSTKVEDFESSDRKVFVAVRIRPCLESHGERYEAKCVRRTDDRTVICSNAAERTRDVSHVFSYDCVFDEGDDQETVFTTCIAELTSLALDGGDVTVMAYGQTGSGKTHTLLGEGLMSADGEHYQLHMNSGMFLRTVSSLLDHRDRSTNYHVVLALTVIEIYQDQFRDLLRSDKQIVNFREVGDDLTLLNQTVVEIRNLEDVVRYFDVAYKNRAVASTLCNDESSRSHAMFFIDILQQARTANTPNPPDPRKILQVQVPGAGPLPYMTERSRTSSRPSTPALSQPPTPVPGQVPGGSDPYPITKSRITFIDLAGSERIKRSGVAGQQLTEALFVNKSLSTLGNVVNNIHANAKHIPFRDSKMTRILRSSFLSGNSRIVFITNTSPTSAGFSETLGSLRFADRLKNLRPPTTLDIGKGSDSNGEVEYLAKLRLCEELFAEMRIAQVACGYTRQLHSDTNPCYVRDRDEFRATVSQYKRDFQTKEDLASATKNGEWNAMVQGIVSAHVEQQPALLAEKKRAEALLRLIDEECEKEDANRSSVANIVKDMMGSVGQGEALDGSVESLTETVSALRDKCARAKLEFEELTSAQQNVDATGMDLKAQEKLKDDALQAYQNDLTNQRNIGNIRSHFTKLKQLVSSYHEVRLENAKAPKWSPQIGVSPLGFHFRRETSRPQYIKPTSESAAASWTDDDEPSTTPAVRPPATTVITQSNTTHQSTTQQPLTATSVNEPPAPVSSSQPSGQRRSRSVVNVSVLRERLTNIIDNVERTGELGNEDVRSIFVVLDEVRVDTEQLERDVIPKIGSDVEISSATVMRYATGGETCWVCVGRMLQALRLYPESTFLIKHTASAIRSAWIHKKPMSVPHFVELLFMENRSHKSKPVSTT